MLMLMQSRLGMYRYMGNAELNGNPGSGGYGPSAGSSAGAAAVAGGAAGGNGALADASGQRFPKYRERCTPLAQLTRLDDGGILDGWKLQGVLLVIRHGDRGAMSHVHAQGINCGVPPESDSVVNRWEKVSTLFSLPLIRDLLQVSQLSAQL